MLERQGRWKLAVFTAIIAPVAVPLLLLVVFAAASSGAFSGSPAGP